MNPKVTANRQKEKKDTLPGFQSDCKSEKGEKQIQIRRQEVTVNREK